MKKKRFVALLALVVALSCCSLFLASCNSEDKSKYEFEGVKTEIALKKTDATFDFLNGVSGKKDGVKTDVKVDSAKVVFGAVGSYEITYTCGTQNAKAIVKIYDAPIITAADASMTYIAINSGITENVTALDSFDKKLEVTVTNDGKDASGKYAYGVNNITYSATDAAGNTATKVRKVTVLETDRPTFAPISADLSKLVVSMPLTGKLDKVIFAGKAYDGVAENKDVLTFKGNNLSKLGVGSHTFSILLENGYSDFVVTITDSKEPNFVFESGDVKTGMNNYVFTDGDEFTLPLVNNADGCYQDLSFAYKINYKGDVVTAIDLKKLGDYTYDVTITKGATKKVISQKIKVVSPAEKLVYLDTARSAQNMDKWMPFRDIGSDISYVNDIKGRPALKFDNKATDMGTTRGLFIDPAYLAAATAKELTWLSFDVCATEVPTGIGSIPGKQISMFLFCDKLKADNTTDWNATGQTGIELNKWTSIAYNLKDLARGAFFKVDSEGKYTMAWDNLSISSTLEGKDAKGGAVNIPHVIYLSNVRFGDPSTKNDILYFNGDDSVQLKSDGKATVTLAGVVKEYKKHSFTQNGVLKVSNVATPHDIDDAVLGYATKTSLMIDGVVFVRAPIVKDFRYSLKKAKDIVFPDYLKNLSENGYSVTYALNKGAEKIKDVTPNEKYTFTSAGDYVLIATAKKAGIANKIFKSNYKIMTAVPSTDGIFGKLTPKDPEAEYSVYGDFKGKSGEIRYAYYFNKGASEKLEDMYLYFTKEYIQEQITAGKKKLVICVYFLEYGGIYAGYNYPNKGGDGVCQGPAEWGWHILRYDITKGVTNGIVPGEYCIGFEKPALFASIGFSE